MNGFDALLLGIIEGITEFLPISSTGHMMIASRILGIGGDVFVQTFEIAIQLGAMLAVLALYPKRLLADMPTILRISAAFLPTAILGALAYPIVKAYLLSDVRIVAYALMIGGVVLIAFERMGFAKKGGVPIASLSLPRAALIGVCQTLAFVPGVSRAAATMIGGMSLGLSRKEAIEFSFFLAVPTMAAATGLDLLKTEATFASGEIILLALGSITAFVVALFSIKFLIHFVEKWTLEPFGYYRILLGALILFLL